MVHATGMINLSPTCNVALGASLDISGWQADGLHVFTELDGFCQLEESNVVVQATVFSVHNNVLNVNVAL